jgi:hypothetical protein
MKFLCVLCVLCGVFSHAAALDRNAFTITKYHLTATVDPEQQRLGVRGVITLRNDSSSPQKNLSLQISSTLDWKSIQFEKQPVQFLTHGYTSDIDHTGELSEAIVTLPREIKPQEIIELWIGYEGTIALNATRLTRIGVSEAEARHTDWDQVSSTFTAVRGIGYVVWYPVSTEAASLSEGNSVEETVGRWKQRHAGSEMDVLFESNVNKAILFSGNTNLAEVNTPADIVKIADFGMSRFGTDVPTFVMTDHPKLVVDANASIYYSPGHEEIAKSLSKQIGDLNNFISPYFRGAAGIEVFDNPDTAAGSFSSAQLLIVPLKVAPEQETKLTLIYALIHSKLYCRHAWMQEGLVHYAQVEYLEQQSGRQAALDYLNAHQQELADAEKQNTQSAHEKPQDADDQSLLNGIDDIQFQAKAMRVWWMLHDMLGTNVNIPLLLYDYKFSDDQSADYIQKLIQGKTHRDLQWFFDDWVYHDRGLPDFRIASVYPSRLPTGGYLITVTVENLGAAGAEVPVTVKIPTGDVTQRLQVLGKSKNSIRFEVPTVPQQVTVNDGSVPESDMSNNTFIVKQ